jgi:hypothetical protein
MGKMSLYAVCFVFWVACWPGASFEMPPDAFMEALTESRMDSLALVLEEKTDPAALTDAEKADYAFRLTGMHRRQRRSLVNDSLILFALDYYKKTDDPRLPEAYLLAAEQVNWSDANVSGKIRLLEEALQLADRKADTPAVRLAGFQLAGLYEAPGDADGIRNLTAVAGKYAGEGGDLLTYLSMGKQFTWENEPDSVLKYTELAMTSARRQGDDREYSLTRSYAECLTGSGRSREALAVLRDLESRMEVGNELQLNYLSAWTGLGELDSARACIAFWQPAIDRYRGHAGKGIEADAVDIILGMYRNVIRTKEGKPAVLNHVAAPVNKVMEQSRNRIGIDRERQFVQNRLLRENLMLDIERGRLRQRILQSGTVALGIVAALVFFYQRKILRKERAVRQSKEQLHSRTVRLKENEAVIAGNEELIRSLSAQLDGSGELKREMEQLETDNERLKEDNRALRDDIERHSRSMQRKDRELSAYEALVGENAHLRERERFLTAQVIAGTQALDRLGKKPRYIDEAQWPETVHAVNRLFDGFSYRLHTGFPSLTEEDVRYCCLIKLRLTTSVMSVLTGVSPPSVTKRKQRIREKMDRQRCPPEIRKDQSLETYIWNY